MRVKPSDGALDDIALVRSINERVPLVGIDNHLRLDAEILQRVPELEDCGGGHSPSPSPTRTSVGVLACLMKVIGDLFA